MRGERRLEHCLGYKGLPAMSWRSVSGSVLCAKILDRGRDHGLFAAGCDHRRMAISFADLGEIMARLGVTVQGLAGGDIYPALERGAIDATEWVGPYDDEKLGFHQIAKNYYYPGWWEPGLMGSLFVRQADFDELPEMYQEVLKSACAEVFSTSLAAYDHANPMALQRMVRDNGVILREYSPDIMEGAWTEANAYLEEQAAADDSFRRVYENWRDFRAQSYPYFAGNELAFANFAFPRIGRADMTG